MLSGGIKQSIEKNQMLKTKKLKNLYGLKNLNHKLEKNEGRFTKKGLSSQNPEMITERKMKLIKEEGTQPI